jgi:hypothetical protein
MKVKRVVAFAVLFAILAALTSSGLRAEADTSGKRPFGTEARVEELEREVEGLKTEIASLKMAPLPDRVMLCGRVIPLSNEDARESFEREFSNFLDNRALLTVLVKRYGKFLSVISGEIEAAKMPPDLIYLAIVESYLNPRAVSKANAGGLWQFVRETGKREGLFINDQIDERYSVTRSTKSALGYLNRLDAEFGDWLVAMAAFNAGEGRLREVIQNQGTRDFFEMFLPEETERYIYRIAAMKEILTNPRKYGLSIEKGDYYRPYAVEELTIGLQGETHTALLAQAMELPYRTFRLYNLHIRRYRLPKGVYHLYIPAEKKETFLRRIRTIPGVTVERDG